MEAIIDRLNRIWCEFAHDEPMWPIHGRYECRACGRHYAVAWGEPPRTKNHIPLFTWKPVRASK